MGLVRIAVTEHDRRRRERTSRTMPAEENEFAAALLIDDDMIACKFSY
jgi:Zn-dependent peptidase ImmA (M78 family)